MDRLEEWRAFATVASLKSFSQAARRLGRSPQAVTRAIASLEARLGTRLLHRTTRSVSLTSDGERYLERSKRAIAEVDALEVPVDAHAPLRGTLSITAPVLFGQLHVMPVVTAFLATHEQMAVKVTLLDRVVSLADEGIDIAVRIGELADSALIARHVGDVRTVVVGSPDYLERNGTPRSPESLARHVCISLSATTPVSDRWAFGKRSIAVAPRLVVNTAQAAVDAAAEGLGLTRVLSYQVDRLVAAGKLKIVLASHEPPPVPVHLVHLPGARSRAAITFAELAAATLRKRLG